MLVELVIVFATLVVLAYVNRDGINSKSRTSRKGRNPFATDSRRAPAPHVADEKLRSRVIQQKFPTAAAAAAADQAFNNIDAIVIGSGIGGLTVAALLARAGKKVIVLEQHDRAGGCTHTFFEKGFEFDSGIHYIGEMRNNTMVKFLLDSMSDGQITWSNLNDEYDRVVLGSADPNAPPRAFPIMSGREEFKNGLKKKFPAETAAIDRYVALLDETRPLILGFVRFKFLPPWLANFLARTPLLPIFFPYFRLAARSLDDVLRSLTSDADLRAVLSYSFGDYGTLPAETSWVMHAALAVHFLYGVSYPVGGASEFAFHMVPVIQSAGGAVLVQARVNSIVMTNGRATGVVVNGTTTLSAPIIISDAGVHNTYETLLPPAVRKSHPAIDHLLSSVRHGPGCMTVFVGLNGSAEELNLTPTNIWAFLKGNNVHEDCKAYMGSDPADFLASADPRIPLLFISFPSCKDPTWASRFPNKSTCEVITIAPWAWFEQWKNERVMKRGADYNALKQSLGQQMWDTVVALHPQLSNRVQVFEVGTPLSNHYFIGSPKGELYGLDHDLARFQPRTVAALRPATPIEGLFLTGQDVFTCGFVGAMFGGLLSASAVLNRNLFTDLVAAKTKFSPQQRK